MEKRTQRPGQEYVGAILSTIETTLGSGDQCAHASAVVAPVPDDAQQTEESEGPKYVPLTEVVRALLKGLPDRGRLDL